MTTTSDSSKLSYFKRFVRAFEIFDEYEDSNLISAEHDIIYAGPAVEDVTPEHRAELEALGWNTEEGSFYHFV